MRIYSELNRAGLTSRQICFIECWGSFSHEDSLDKDKVSFNNILNSIKEITFLYHTPGISKREKKRKLVAEELLAILKEDSALQDPVFRNIPNRLLHMLDYKDAWSDIGRSPIEKEQGLIENYFEELKSLLIENDFPININLLENELNKTSIPTQDEYGKVVQLCNNIMSFMLTLGIPLKECNYLFERTLLKNPYTFNVRFQSWKSKVNIREQAYIVTFSMEQ